MSKSTNFSEGNSPRNATLSPQRQADHYVGVTYLKGIESFKARIRRGADYAEIRPCRTAHGAGRAYDIARCMLSGKGLNDETLTADTITTDTSVAERLSVLMALKRQGLFPQHVDDEKVDTDPSSYFTSVSAEGDGYRVQFTVSISDDMTIYPWLGKHDIEQAVRIACAGRHLLGRAIDGVDLPLDHQLDLAEITKGLVRKAYDRGYPAASVIDASYHEASWCVEGARRALNKVAGRPLIEANEAFGTLEEIDTYALFKLALMEPDTEPDLTKDEGQEKTLVQVSEGSAGQSEAHMETVAEFIQSVRALRPKDVRAIRRKIGWGMGVIAWVAYCLYGDDRYRAA